MLSTALPQSAPDCPNCGTHGLRVFHQAPGVPTNSCLLLPTAEEARAYPRGDIRLGFCTHCAFITNTAFDARLTEYSGRYEETQGFSPTFQAFHRQLAERLIRRFALQDKTILEIGCGKGEFLQLLCSGGRNHGVGFDPAYHPDRHAPAAGERIEFVRDFYSEHYRQVAADFICCKMTLEHIGPVVEFLASVRRAIGNREVDVFFMIPETRRILETCAFEDIYYEHVSYFTPASLHYLFSSQGLRVQEIGNEYGGQYLTIIASTRAAAKAVAPPDAATIAPLVEGFAQAYRRKVEVWHQRLTRHRTPGRCALIWGSGSKGVSFLTSLGLSEAEICAAVDINPHRQGYFMPGSGHPIVGPQALKRFDPDRILIMNSIYREEIAAQLAQLGISARILTLEDA